MKVLSADFFIRHNTLSLTALPNCPSFASVAVMKSLAERNPHGGQRNLFAYNPGYRHPWGKLRQELGHLVTPTGKSKKNKHMGFCLLDPLTLFRTPCLRSDVTHIRMGLPVLISNQDNPQGHAHWPS